MEGQLGILFVIIKKIYNNEFLLSSTSLLSSFAKPLKIKILNSISSFLTSLPALLAVVVFVIYHILKKSVTNDPARFVQFI